ncbi:MAG: hypothetical protein V4594_14885 [Bacteroidota bacterium]
METQKLNSRELKASGSSPLAHAFSRCMAAIVAIIATVTLQSCNLAGKMDGTYVNSAGSEFSIANDTLVVEQSQDNHYQIHRSTGFRLLDDQGRPGKLQYEKEEWTAVYDPGTEVLSESRNGVVITFNADRSMMIAGKRKYKRIK